MKVPEIKRGQWLIIRVDGTEEPMEGRPSIYEVYQALGCECIDTVSLVKDSSGQALVVMIVDDTGMIDRKPVNPKATAMMRFTARGILPCAIHGDVALVNDEDFA